MTKNINVKDLMNYLPHRPPMVWIDEVSEVGQDYKGLVGTCLVKVDRKSLYVNNGKELRASSAIEFTAQGFGYLKAAYQVMHNINNPPSETYLTGVRSCKANFEGVDLTNVSELQVKLSVLRELSPVTFVRGELSIPGDDKILAEAEIQVYFD